MIEQIRYRDICWSVGASPVGVVGDYMDALRATQNLELERIPSFAKPVETVSVSLVKSASPVVTSPAGGSEAMKVDSGTSIDKLEEDSDTAAHEDVRPVGHSMPKDSRIRRPRSNTPSDIVETGNKRSLKESPSNKAKGSVKRARADPERISSEEMVDPNESFDLRGLSVLELSVVDPDIIPESVELVRLSGKSVLFLSCRSHPRFDRRDVLDAFRRVGILAKSSGISTTTNQISVASDASRTTSHASFLRRTSTFLLCRTLWSVLRARNVAP